MAEAEGDLAGGAEAEHQHEQRQQDRLRDAVEQQHDRIEAAAADVGQSDQHADQHPEHHRHHERHDQLDQRDADGRRTRGSPSTFGQSSASTWLGAADSDEVANTRA